jgi:hypothetical protein
VSILGGRADGTSAAGLSGLEGEPRHVRLLGVPGAPGSVGGVEDSVRVDLSFEAFGGSTPPGFGAGRGVGGVRP